MANSMLYCLNSFKIEVNLFGTVSSSFLAGIKLSKNGCHFPFLCFEFLGVVTAGIGQNSFDLVPEI